MTQGKKSSMKLLSAIREQEPDSPKIAYKSPIKDLNIDKIEDKMTKYSNIISS